MSAVIWLFIVYARAARRGALNTWPEHMRRRFERIDGEEALRLYDLIELRAA